MASSASAANWAHSNPVHDSYSTSLDFTSQNFTNSPCITIKSWNVLRQKLLNNPKTKFEVRLIQCDTESSSPFEWYKINEVVRENKSEKMCVRKAVLIKRDRKSVSHVVLKSFLEPWGNQKHKNELGITWMLCTSEYRPAWFLRCYGCFEAGPQIPESKTLESYIVTENLDYSLRDLLKNFSNNSNFLRNVSMENLMHVIFYFLTSLEFIHSQNIVHRDINASNVMFSMVNRVVVPKIIDFGESLFVGSTLSRFVKPAMFSAPEIWYLREAGHEKPSHDEVAQPCSTTAYDCFSAGCFLLLMAYPKLYADFYHNSNYIEVLTHINHHKSLDGFNSSKFPGADGNPLVFQVLQDIIVGLLDFNPETRFNIQGVVNHLRWAFPHEISNWETIGKQLFP